MVTLYTINYLPRSNPFNFRPSDISTKLTLQGRILCPRINRSWAYCFWSIRLSVHRHPFIAIGIRPSASVHLCIINFNISYQMHSVWCIFLNLVCMFVMSSASYPILRSLGRKSGSQRPRLIPLKCTPFSVSLTLYMHVA